MSSGNGHNLDLSLGISNGSKGKDNAGDCLSRCNRERLMVALQSFTMLTLFFFLMCNLGIVLQVFIP